MNGQCHKQTAHMQANAPDMCCFYMPPETELKASAPGGKSQIGSTDNLDGFATSGHDIYAGGQTAQIKR